MAACHLGNRGKLQTEVGKEDNLVDNIEHTEDRTQTSKVAAKEKAEGVRSKAVLPGIHRLPKLPLGAGGRCPTG